MSPLETLSRWLQEERESGIAFPNGAVLGTVDSTGQPRTRMLGVHFDDHRLPRFHTTPGSRKVDDLSRDNRASLTFAFQKSLRSVSLEGELTPLTPDELASDWLLLDKSFRRSYLVFGVASGQPLSSPSALSEARAALKLDAEDSVPEAFVGFRFHLVHRVAFYSVGEGEFAEHIVHAYDRRTGSWSVRNLIP